MTGPAEFEWVTCEVRRPHPAGKPVVPRGAWENATLVSLAADHDVGEAWFKPDGDTLLVDVKIPAAHGGTDEQRVRELIACGLLGPDGLAGGHYHGITRQVFVRNLVTHSEWRGSWAQLSQVANQPMP